MLSAAVASPGFTVMKDNTAAVTVNVAESERPEAGSKAVTTVVPMAEVVA